MRLELIDLEKKEFKLLEDVFVVINEEGDRVRIPQDFVTDLASIPAFLFWLQWGKWNKAALVHDHLYANGFVYIQPLDSSFEYTAYFNRQKADSLFHDILLLDKVNPILAWLMYIAVRIFGAKLYWLMPIEE